MQEKRYRVEASARVCLERVAVVLFKPRLAENIGAVARAACNMGSTVWWRWRPWTWTGAAWP